jgi:hypothetical protein
MKQPATTCATFLAGMVLACSAGASDINKCVTAAGTVTLTDAPCPSGADTVRVFAGTPDNAAGNALAPTQAVVTPERFTVGRLPPRYVVLARGTRPARGLALDVATLRAARLNLHLLDNAADVLRSQRVAALH